MGKKAPDPTPPQETSAAQTGSNVSTAIANAFLTNTNEITADGTKTYEQTGSYSWTDDYTGESYDVPTFTLTQTLSDEQQAIKDQQDAASLNLATLGNNLSDTIGDQLTGNFSLGNEEVESRLFDLGSKRLDPMFERREEDLRNRLANQGIKAGSDAYAREMETFNQSQTDAYNQLLLQGRGQASQELLTEDNQRINQIGALLSGGQVSQPNFMTGFNVDSVPTTDNAGIIANYDQQLAANAAQNAAGIGSVISGIGGLFALSDERIKENKTKIGETKDGLGIFAYNKKGSDQTEIGMMAQEVAKKKPQAVAQDPETGLLMVNYAEAIRGRKKEGA
jgi:hypothetical protein